MDKLSRLSRLQRLVADAGGEIDGRKRLHKLAYLVQRAGADLGQAFEFHMYGVYSPSLAQDVRAAEAWKLLVEENPSNGSSFLIHLGKEKTKPSAIASDEEAGFTLAKELKSQPTAVLEVMSTIVYLWDAGYRGERLVEKLRDLKGHLDRYFDPAFELVAKYFGIGAAVEAR